MRAGVSTVTTDASETGGLMTFGRAMDCAVAAPCHLMQRAERDSSAASKSQELVL
jgi:hypothetical protein